MLDITHKAIIMLYKYFSIARRDVLERQLVRLTQPGDFNDPFELHPSYDLMSKADIAALPEAPGQEGTPGPKMRILTPEAMQAMFAAVLPGLQKQIAQRAGQEGAYVIDNNRLAQATFDSKFGILCLTEHPDSLLMWAHYANNHNGFVIQFDETHELFAPIAHEGQVLQLTKVEYSAQRPVLSYSSINSTSVYYRKSPEWAYESEWRIIKPLSGACSILAHPEYPRCLFELPSAAVKGVIVGLSVSHPVRLELFELLAQPQWKHVTVFQAALNKNEYKLDIHPPVSGVYPPEALRFVICEAR
jgi:Protein of unknown function (DUF2971)